MEMSIKSNFYHSFADDLPSRDCTNGSLKGTLAEPACDPDWELS
jgi:hypothetical protein